MPYYRERRAGELPTAPKAREAQRKNLTRHNRYRIPHNPRFLASSFFLSTSQAKVVQCFVLFSDRSLVGKSDPTIGTVRDRRRTCSPAPPLAHIPQPVHQIRGCFIACHCPVPVQAVVDIGPAEPLTSTAAPTTASWTSTLMQDRRTSGKWTSNITWCLPGRLPQLGAGLAVASPANVTARQAPCVGSQH